MSNFLNFDANKNETIFHKTVRGINMCFYHDIIFFYNVSLVEIVRVDIMPKISYEKNNSPNNRLFAYTLIKRGLYSCRCFSLTWQQP